MRQHIKSFVINHSAFRNYIFPPYKGMSICQIKASHFYASDLDPSFSRFPYPSDDCQVSPCIPLNKRWIGGKGDLTNLALFATAKKSPVSPCLRYRIVENGWKRQSLQHKFVKQRHETVGNSREGPSNNRTEGRSTQNDWSDSVYVSIVRQGSPRQGPSFQFRACFHKQCQKGYDLSMYLSFGFYQCAHLHDNGKESLSDLTARSSWSTKYVIEIWMILPTWKYRNKANVRARLRKRWTKR